MSDSSTETLGKLNNTEAPEELKNMEAPEEAKNTEVPEELKNTEASEKSSSREALENLYNTEQAYVLLVRKKRKENKKSRNAASAGGEVRRQTAPAQDGDIPEAVEKIRVGKLHNIGKREQQQDSLGVADTADGVFAVIADGMGGLSDGDKVSQKIVMTMLQDAAPMPGDGRTPGLFEMVAHANEEVNRMLGVQNHYRAALPWSRSWHARRALHGCPSVTAGSACTGTAG